MPSARTQCTASAQVSGTCGPGVSLLSFGDLDLSDKINFWRTIPTKGSCRWVWRTSAAPNLLRPMRSCPTLSDARSSDLLIPHHCAFPMKSTWCYRRGLGSVIASSHCERGEWPKFARKRARKTGVRVDLARNSERFRLEVPSKWHRKTAHDY